MRIRLILLPVAAVLAIAPGFAGQIVHFKSGSTMAVIDHSIDEGMIQVVLGPGSQIAFPIELVERITESGADVFTSEDAATPNQMVEGRPTPVVDTRVSGRPPSAYTRGRWIGNDGPSNPRVSRDSATGLTVLQPREGGVRVTGQLDILNGPAPRGLAPDESGAAPPVLGARPFGRGYIAKMPDEVHPGRRLLVSMTDSDKPDFVRPRAVAEGEAGSGE